MVVILKARSGAEPRFHGSEWKIIRILIDGWAPRLGCLSPRQRRANGVLSLNDRRRKENQNQKSEPAFAERKRGRAERYWAAHRCRSELGLADVIPNVVIANNRLQHLQTHRPKLILNDNLLFQ